MKIESKNSKCNGELIYKYSIPQFEEILVETLIKQLAEIEHSRYLQMKKVIEEKAKLKNTNCECRIILFSALNWKPFKKVI